MQSFPILQHKKITKGRNKKVGKLAHASSRLNETPYCGGRGHRGQDGLL